MNSSREWPCPEPATIHVHHAPEAPSAKTICIDRILPRGEDALVAHARHQIADVLYAALPGGTIDALLAEMITRRGTMLRALLARIAGTRAEDGLPTVDRGPLAPTPIPGVWWHA